MKRETWLAGVIVCGALIAGGAFLPWAHSGLFTVSGMAGDGIFAIGIGGALVVMAAAGYGGSRAAGYGVQLFGGLAFALGVLEWLNLANKAPDSVGAGSTGLILIAAAGFVAALIFGGVPQDAK